MVIGIRNKPKRLLQGTSRKNYLVTKYKERIKGRNAINKVKSNFPIKLSVLTQLNYSKVIILPKANISEGKFFIND